MNKSTIIFLLIILLGFSCTNKVKKKDYGEYEKLYNDKCVSCHNYKQSNTDYHPSFFEMIEMDSVSLVLHLNKAFSDSTHLKFVPISDGEKKGLCDYLIHYKKKP